MHALMDTVYTRTKRKGYLLQINRSYMCGLTFLFTFSCFDDLTLLNVTPNTLQSVHLDLHCFQNRIYIWVQQGKGYWKGFKVSWMIIN